MTSSSSRTGTPPVAVRVAVAGIVGSVIVGILVLRLWALTVLGGADYAERADQNVIRRLPVVAPRGSILDRNGRQIVVNDTYQQVEIDLQDIDDTQLEHVITELGRVLAPSARLANLTTDRIRQRVEDAPPGAIEPVVVARDVDRIEVVHYLAEHASEFPGVNVREAYKRRYVHGSTAAHILGQVGSVDPQDLDRHPTLQPIDKIGKSGLEKRYDEYLRGINGYDAIQVDAAGVRTDAPGVRGLPATNGRNLVTTIDLGLQQATERALAEAVARAGRTKDGHSAKSGAAVAIDPATGEVLSLASYPTYDPNVFGATSPAAQRSAAMLVNPKNRREPMFNRAIAAAEPPGSIFKPITAIAAMAEGFVTPTETLPCPPHLEIYRTTFDNHMDSHLGSIPLATAMETSCDTYFYKLAIDFYNDPGAPLQAWSRRFGLGAPTGIDIPGEAEGLVPTRQWKKTVTSEIWTETDRLWKPGDSVNLSIGQGNLLVSPIQMANVYATIANGGTLRTPRLAKSIQDLSGREEVALSAGEARDLTLDRRQINAVVDALVRVNTGPNGTATGVFGSFKVSTAGKTGTAEKQGQSDHAWYCGFAPVDKPTIAACAFIDGGGHGGAVAAPVVLKMYQQWFGADGGNVRVQGTVE